MRLEEQSKQLDSSEEQLRVDLLETNKEEQKFVDEVSKKYGPGQLDPTNGTFTPNAPVEETQPAS